MIKFDKPVILVGQGEVHERLLRAMARDYPLIALDGGLQKIKALGLDADVIIGDMDSCAPDLSSKSGAKILHIDEQDSNDFEKALYSIEAPYFIGFGLLGGRFDQVMANLHGLVKYLARKRTILISPYEILCCVKGAVEISLSADCACAVLPIEPISFKSSSGLRYPIDGLRLEMGSLISSSNHIDGQHLSLIPDDEDSEKPYFVSCAVEAIDDILTYVEDASSSFATL